MNNRGSITIFVAVVFATLMIFLVSIYEVTRLQILDLQAKSIVLSAGDSLLAGYDNVLKNEYGIFSRDMNYCDVDFIYPNKIESVSPAELISGDVFSSPISLPRISINQISSDFEYYLNENVKSNELILKDSFVAISDSIKSESGLNYVKKEITDYTISRIPVSTINNVLLSFDMAVKLGKTTALTEKKNNIISKASKMEQDFSLLYYFIDGIDVKKEILTPKVIPRNFVNRFFVGKGPEHIPDEMVTYECVNIISLLSDTKSAFEQITKMSDGLSELYNDFRPINEEYISLTDDLQDIISEIESIKSSISRMEEDIDYLEVSGEDTSSIESEFFILEEDLAELYSKKSDIESMLNDIRDDYNRLVNKISARMTVIDEKVKILNNNLPMINALTVDGYYVYVEDNEKSEFGNSSSSLLTNNKKALALVQNITSNGHEVGTDIRSFISNEEPLKDEYVKGSYEEAKNSLGEIERVYGFATEDNYNKENNLKLMEENLKVNVDILERVSGSVDYIDKNFFDDMGNAMYIEGVSNQMISYLNEYTVDSEDIEAINRKLNYGSDGNHSDFVRSIDNIKINISDYRTLDYLKYDNRFEEKNDFFLGVFATLKDNFLGYKETLSNIVSGINGYDLPDDLGIGGITEDIEINTDFDQTDINSLKADEVMGYIAGFEKISSLTELKNNILINEYIASMFKGYPDLWEPRENLSGYQLSKHLYDTELEYIITGDKNQTSSVSKIATKLFAMRVPINSLHLTINPQKRETIMGIANAVAGWWSLGSMTIIIGLIIGLLWAAAESMIDVALLLGGGKVPLFKNASTWLTSAKGLTSKGIIEAKKAAISAAKGGANYIVSEMPDELMIRSKALGEQLKDDHNTLVSDKLDDIYQKCTQTINASVEEIDIIVSDEIDKAISKKRNGENIYSEETVGKNSSEYSVINEAIEIIEKEEITDQNYNSYVELKSKVMEDISEKLKNKKESIKNEHINKINALFEKAISTMEEGKELANDKANEHLETYFNELTNDLDAQTKSLLSDSGMNTADYYNVSLSYYDYLKLIMLLEYKDQDKRLRRMMDIIDINITHQKNKSYPVSVNELILDNYAYKIDVEASFTGKFKFINISEQLFGNNNPYFNRHKKETIGYE